MYLTLLVLDLQQGLILPPEFIRFVCFIVLFLSKFCQVHFLFCWSLQDPPPPPRLVPLFCFIFFFISCLLFVSLSFCYCLMRVSFLFYVL